MIVWKALTRGEACGLHWEDNMQPGDMGLGQHAGSIKQKNKQPPPLDIFTRSRSKGANTLQGGHRQPSFEGRAAQAPGMMPHGPFPGSGHTVGHRSLVTAPHPDIAEN